MIFCNFRNTEPVFELRNRQVFTERRPLSNCHRKEGNRNRDVNGVDFETLILPLQNLTLRIFEIEHLFVDFCPAFRDLVPRDARHVLS